MTVKPGGRRRACLICRLLLAVFVVLAGAGAGVRPALAQQPELPGVSARAAVLMDYQTGHVLYSYMASKRLAPASTTKVITALLGLDMGRAGEVVTVSPYASGTEGTSLYLRPGESFDLRDLIKGALVNSGNDAAVAIGEHIAGTESAFASLMTYKAKTIGALQSNFMNPHGLDNPRHYCTAYDLALITRYALSEQFFRQFVQTRDDVIYEQKTHTPVNLRNTNQLLWSNKNSGIRVIGVKTGTTSNAGQCLVAAAEKDGQVLITVVLDSADRYADTRQLLQYGYEECRWYKLPKGKGLFALPLAGGDRPSVLVAPDEDICFAVNPQEDPLLEKRVEVSGAGSGGPGALKSPLPSGNLVGKVDFYLGDRFLFGTGLRALTPVAKKSILKK
ncbi:MAG: D-alanyl-D-alanine carboxypeptidase family protein [Thermacetogeniaceae bacterium]